MKPLGELACRAAALAGHARAYLARRAEPGPVAFALPGSVHRRGRTEDLRRTPALRFGDAVFGTNGNLPLASSGQ